MADARAAPGPATNPSPPSLPRPANITVDLDQERRLAIATVCGKKTHESPAVTVLFADPSMTVSLFSQRFDEAVAAFQKTYNSSSYQLWRQFREGGAPGAARCRRTAEGGLARTRQAGAAASRAGSVSASQGRWGGSDDTRGAVPLPARSQGAPGAPGGRGDGRGDGRLGAFHDATDRNCDASESCEARLSIPIQMNQIRNGLVMDFHQRMFWALDASVQDMEPASSVSRSLVLVIEFLEKFDVFPALYVLYAIERAIDEERVRLDAPGQGGSRDGARDGMRGPGGAGAGPARPAQLSDRTQPRGAGRGSGLGESRDQPAPPEPAELCLERYLPYVHYLLAFTFHLLAETEAAADPSLVQKSFFPLIRGRVGDTPILSTTLDAEGGGAAQPIGLAPSQPWGGVSQDSWAGAQAPRAELPRAVGFGAQSINVIDVYTQLQLYYLGECTATLTDRSLAECVAVLYLARGCVGEAYAVLLTLLGEAEACKDLLSQMDGRMTAPFDMLAHNLSSQHPGRGKAGAGEGGASGAANADTDPGSDADRPLAHFAKALIDLSLGISADSDEFMVAATGLGERGSGPAGGPAHGLPAADRSLKEKMGSFYGIFYALNALCLNGNPRFGRCLGMSEGPIVTSLDDSLVDVLLTGLSRAKTAATKSEVAAVSSVVILESQRRAPSQQRESGHAPQSCIDGLVLVSNHVTDAFLKCLLSLEYIFACADPDLSRTLRTVIGTKDSAAIRRLSVEHNDSLGQYAQYLLLQAVTLRDNLAAVSARSHATQLVVPRLNSAFGVYSPLCYYAQCMACLLDGTEQEELAIPLQHQLLGIQRPLERLRARFGREAAAAGGGERAEAGEAEAGGAGEAREPRGAREAGAQ